MRPDHAGDAGASGHAPRVLTFTTLYPNAEQPNSNVFVENRVRHVAASGEVPLRVVAPVPWFPFRTPAFGRYAQLARIPRLEMRHGLHVMHPRYPVIPKFGMQVAPSLLRLATRAVLRNLQVGGFDFDLIDAHYMYPDGVAAVRLGRDLGKPVVVTCRGTDVHTIPRYPGPRRLIQRAAREAAALVTVSQALKSELIRLGAPDERIRVLPNGVDLDHFRPGDRELARRELGVSGRVVVAVARLVPVKRHELMLRALVEIPDATLVMVGEGPLRDRLAALSRELGVADRVRLVGEIAHQRMPAIYSAADLLLLTSEREGWPNVLLEAMACGTPVVAVAVWGIPEVVKAPAAGRLVDSPDPPAIAAVVKGLLDDPPARQATRTYAERFGWESTTRGQIELFRSLADGRREVAAA